MISLLGYFTLAAGMVAALSATYCWSKVGRDQDRPEKTNSENYQFLRRAGVASTYAMLAAAAAACGLLEWALLSHDFSIRYVAENGNTAVPAYYTVISLWGALQGSLLLWLLILTVLTVAVMLRRPVGAVELHPWAVSVLGVVAAFFFALALFAGNAFETIAPAPTNGPGPNPLLQDNPLMGVHPPLLYLGYVGMTVPFSFAVAALITGRTGTAWVAVTRRWTLLAWTSLSIAIVMGGWWSYQVLGWGGYWAWDPVENASILPWFTATALLHSVMVQHRRATLRLWNLALAIATFLLVLIGTFLTRSGVIESVHSFTQSRLGPVLLGFIIVVFVGSGALFIWRADRIGPTPGLAPRLSRETAILGNNLLLVGLALTVLIGTVFPLLAEAVNGSRLSVGAPYFNRMAVPLALAVILLMGIGPLIPWVSASPRTLARRLVAPLAVGMAVVGALGLAGLHGLTALFTFGLAGFVLTGIVGQFVLGAAAARRLHQTSRLSAPLVAVARRRRLYGGLIVHTGIVLAAVAIAASSTYTTGTQRKLTIGQTLQVGGYSAQLTGISRHHDARRMWVEADVVLRRDGRPVGRMEPAMSFYPSSTEQAIGTPAVHSTLGGDAYLLLDQVDPAGRWAVLGLSLHPMVGWLWIAPGVMAAGALLAGWPDRRRRRDVPEPAEAATSEEAIKVRA